MRRNYFPGWGLSDETVENLGYKVPGHHKGLVYPVDAPYLGPDVAVEVDPECFTMSKEVIEEIKERWNKIITETSAVEEKAPQKTIGVRVVYKENK